DPAYIKQAIEGSRERLGLHRIDLYQSHTPDPAVPYEDTIRAFEELREDGFVRHIGVSNVTVEHIQRALEIVPIATVQNRFNLGDRHSEDVLDFCEANNIGFIPWFPLSAGDLDAQGSVVADVAGELGATASQVALAWLLARSPVMLPIPGTGSVAHLEENLGAADLELTQEQFARIDDASLAANG
ncbi:MAG: aldo/keto reductase, partial [Thermoleophilia bacterium]|nr:aldo/keto reductase [Thermoleophilia bacterium]